MQRIGVIADAHGNLPATRAALDALEAAQCEVVVHVGDAVGIGPYPGEVVSLLLERRVECVMGNHDEWAAFGLPEPLPPWISEGEAEHQRWTHGQLDDTHREAVRDWPYLRSLKCGGATVTFIHYPRWPNGGFTRLTRRTEELEGLYHDVIGDVVVFGHDHRAYDVPAGGRRFLNPGSAGCHHEPRARALGLTHTSTPAPPRRSSSSTPIQPPRFGFGTVTATRSRPSLRSAWPKSISSGCW